MFFLSGALFPLANVPVCLQWASYVNPLTYGVDALRTVMMGDTWVQLFPMSLDILVLVCFDSIMFLIGKTAFCRTE